MPRPFSSPGLTVAIFDACSVRLTGGGQVIVWSRAISLWCAFQADAGSEPDTFGLITRRSLVPLLRRDMRIQAPLPEEASERAPLLRLWVIDKRTLDGSLSVAMDLVVDERILRIVKYRFVSSLRSSECSEV